MKTKKKSIAEQVKDLPPCPRPCSVCSPGHHWYLDFMSRKLGARCKHCDARLDDIDPDDPDCPEY